MPPTSASFMPRGLSAGHRVDVLDLTGQRHGLPGIAAVLRPEDLAVVARADIDLLGVFGMQADRHDRAVHLDLVEAFPALAIVLAAVEATVVARRGDAQRCVE